MSTLFTVLPVYANAFRMMEGDLLQYEYGRIDSNGGGQTDNVASTITSLSQTNGYSTSQGARPISIGDYSTNNKN